MNMTQPDLLDPFLEVRAIVARNTERRIALLQLEGRAAMMGVLAHANRRLGQMARRYREKVERRR